MSQLYTQCPECSTVFRVTADALRAAQGRVRCGICSSGFSALDNLSEQPVQRMAWEPRDEDTITVEELPGNEFIELSTAADQAVGATAARPAEAPPTPPADGPAAADAEDLSTTAFEYRGSVEDLDQVFVRAEPAGPMALLSGAGAAQHPDHEVAALEQAIDEIASSDFSGMEVEESDGPWPEAEEDDGEDDDPDRTDEYPVLVLGAEGAALPDWLAQDAEQDVEAEPAEPAEPANTAEDAAESASGETAADATDTADDVAKDEATAEAAIDDAPPVLLIPEELRRGVEAANVSVEELERPGGGAPAAHSRRWPLALGTALLALLLLAQAVHHWRDGIARHPTFGPWMLGAYGLLGLDVPAPVDLGAFDLRQLGAASDTGQAGRIKVRASIVNRAPFAQPYPLLRLTLQDRFGTTIGERVLEPAEYLPGGTPPASGLLGSNDRADAEVVFLDPGRDAVGFELDVCVPAASGILCSQDLPRGAT